MDGHRESVANPWWGDKRTRRGIMALSNDADFYTEVWSRIKQECRYYPDDPNLALVLFRGQPISDRRQVAAPQ